MDFGYLIPNYVAKYLEEMPEDEFPTLGIDEDHDAEQERLEAERIVREEVFG